MCPGAEGPRGLSLAAPEKAELGAHPFFFFLDVQVVQAFWENTKAGQLPTLHLK